MQNKNKPRSINFYSNMNYSTIPSPQFATQPHNISHNDSFIDDEIDSQAEPAFQTKNYMFEMQSRLNKLEYEKAKIAVAHENILSEFRHKNNYLEQLAGNLSLQNQELAEERDEVLRILNDVRQQNHNFSKEIHSLRIELENISKRDIGNQSYQSDVDHYPDLMQEISQKNDIIDRKNQEIDRLQKQMNKYESSQKEVSTRSDFTDNYKKTISSLEKQKAELTQQLESANNRISAVLSENQDARSAMRERQELMKIVKAKDTALSELRQEKLDLSLQIESLKEELHLKDRRNIQTQNDQVKRLTQNLMAKEEQLKAGENERMQLDNKISQFSMEISRLKCQKNGLQQYNKYLQGCNTENEAKRKLLQDDLYKYQKEISDLRSQIFNQKLECKKLLNNIKLQFEQQKIKNLESLEEKSKEINKLKEYSLSSNRQNIEFEEINFKNQNIANQLQRALQQVSVYKAENQTIRENLRNLQAKYEKKSQKYVGLQKDIRSEYEKRIKSLQSEIYKFQIQNSQLQLKLQYQTKQKKESKPSDPKKDEDVQNLKELIELLKMDKEEQGQTIKEMAQREKERESTLKILNENIRKLEGELRVAKENPFKQTVSRQDAHDKIRIITELEGEINRLNEQLRKQRSVVEQKRREIQTKDQRFSSELRRAQQQRQKLARHNEELKANISNIKNELIKKDSQLANKQEIISKTSKEIDALKQQNYTIRSNGGNYESKVADLERQVEQLRRNKQKEIETYKRQIKELYDGKIQAEQRNLVLLREKQKKDSIETKPDVSQNTKMNQLQKQNYTLKYQYSEALQQINTLLVKFQNIEQKYKKLHSIYDKTKQRLQQVQAISSKAQLYQRENRQSKQTIANCQSQIRRLNQVLMDKQQQLKQYYTCPHIPKGSSGIQYNKFERSYMKGSPKHYEDHSNYPKLSYQQEKRKQQLEEQGRRKNPYLYKL